MYVLKVKTLQPQLFHQRKHPSFYYSGVRSQFKIFNLLINPNINQIYIYHSIGYPKHQRVMAGAIQGDSFIGNKQQELRGLLRISHPMAHGIMNYP